MRALIVTGDDYAALQFQDKFANTEVSHILENINDFSVMEHGGNIPDEEGYWELEVVEVGDVSPEFLGFVRNFIDYDDSKHRAFYLENEKVAR